MTQSDNLHNYRQFSRCHEIASLKDFIEQALTEIGRLDPQKRIIFILDSLDQLTPDDYKSIDKWLLTNLPPNTKYIVSTIPNHGNLLDMIWKLIRKKYDQQLKLVNIMSSKTSNKDDYKGYYI